MILSDAICTTGVNLYERVKGIYLIERISGPEDGPKFYIGQASDIFARLNQHSTLLSGDGQAIDVAIKELTPMAFRFQVVEIVDKQEDRDTRERHWIAQHISDHGAARLYNQQTGGKRGSKSLDDPSAARKKNLREAVRGLFKEEIGYSVYLAAEHFGIGADVVISWRKLELEKQGLKFDAKSRSIVVVSTGRPIGNWAGGVLTEQQVGIYKSLRDKPMMSDSELREAMRVMSSDLRSFKEEYSEGYLVAEEVCDPSVAKRHAESWRASDQQYVNPPIQQSLAINVQ